MPAFNAKQRRQFVLAMCALNIGNTKSHHHPVRMPRRLFINRIDQIERVVREMALIGFRFDPNGEKFRSKVSSFCLVEADVAGIFGVGGPNVVVLVKKTLRSVGMSVDNNRGVLNLERFLANRSLCGRGNTTESKYKEERKLIHGEPNSIRCVTIYSCNDVSDGATGVPPVHPDCRGISNVSKKITARQCRLAPALRIAEAAARWRSSSWDT